MIPDRLLFLWTGRRFPYFARLAIESALLAEPRSVVELHVFGDAPEGPHLDAIRALDRVEIHAIDLDRAFDGLGVDARALRATFARIPTSAASSRANLLRYAVLARRGGVYLDTDVLVVRDFAALRGHAAFAGQEQVLSIDAARVAGERSVAMLPAAMAWAAAYALRRSGLSVLEPIARRLDPRWQVTALNNAVLGAAPGAAFVRHLLTRATQVDSTIRYRLGPTLITEVAAAHPGALAVLPPEAFYLVPPSYSFRFFSGGPFPIPAATRVLHVVASNHRGLLERLDETELHRNAGRGLYYGVGAEVAARARELARGRAAA